MFQISYEIKSEGKIHAYMHISDKNLILQKTEWKNQGLIDTLIYVNCQEVEQ